MTDNNDADKDFTNNILVLNKCELANCTYQKSEILKESLLCTPCTLNTIRRMMGLIIPHPLSNELIEKVLTTDDLSNRLAQHIHRAYQYYLFQQRTLIDSDNRNTAEGKNDDPKNYL